MFCRADEESSEGSSFVWFFLQLSHHITSQPPLTFKGQEQDVCKLEGVFNILNIQVVTG